MKGPSNCLEFSRSTAFLFFFSVVVPLVLVDLGDAVFPNILYFLLLCPLILIGMLIHAFMRRESPLFVAAGVYLAISLVSFQGRLFLRYHERWFTHREPYRSQVLSQARSKGELQHVVWDDWGGFGAPPTVTYLVYDPDGKLSGQRLKDGGAIPGVPCDVWLIHRLGPRWYSLTFYTGTFWDACTY